MGTKSIEIKDAFKDSKEDYIPLFYFTIGERISQKEITYELPWGELNRRLGFLKTSNEYWIQRDNCYHQFIKNILIKNNYLEMYQELITEQINQEEFNRELSENYKKYVIEFKEIDNEDYINCANGISYEFQNELQDLDLHEVAELLSINSNHLVSSKNILKK
jgi:hypothetical protein